jgi:hypothetical protein
MATGLRAAGLRPCYGLEVVHVERLAVSMCQCGGEEVRVAGGAASMITVK